MAHLHLQLLGLGLGLCLCLASSAEAPRRPPDSLSALLTPAARSAPAPAPVPLSFPVPVQQPKADAFINEVTELLTGSGAGVSPAHSHVVITPPLFPAEDSWPGSCRLRSKRYVSDGLCMSPRPLTEVVCADTCVMTAWTKGGSRPLPWRCSDAGWRRHRAKLRCRDGSTRVYRIRVVQSCRCVPRQGRGRGRGRGRGAARHRWTGGVVVEKDKEGS